MDDELRASLRESYGRKGTERDRHTLEPWKQEERQRFLALLQDERRRTLLEVGAGPGADGKFFADNGLEVFCTDLSPEMVALCHEKGLRARVMDASRVDLPHHSFDAAYSLTCLLHLPVRELPSALCEIRDVLKPGGLFYLGLYGGRDQEGVWTHDSYEPKRFFAFHTDEHLRELVAASFEVCSFRRVTIDGLSNGLHFQSLVLRRSKTANAQAGSRAFR